MWDDLSAFEIFLAGCAAVGGALMLLRLLMMLVGALAHGDGDFTLGDLDYVDVDETQFTESDIAFQLLSLQGISSFLTMFGVIGLALVNTLPAGPLGSVLSIVGGAAAGLSSVWVITKLFRLARTLQSDGTRDPEDAIGEEGTVYLSIPACGRGKVFIDVQGRRVEFDAESETSSDIKTGVRVRVVRVVAGSVMSVETLGLDADQYLS